MVNYESNTTSPGDSPAAQHQQLVDQRRDSMVASYQQQAEQSQDNLIARMRLSRTGDGRFVAPNGEIVAEDSRGRHIYYDQIWLRDALKYLLEASTMARDLSMDDDDISELIDMELFGRLRISELSTGFEEMYALRQLLMNQG
jgi:hypothetical protein